MEKIKLFKWYQATKDNPKPDDGEIIIGWLKNADEPCALRAKHEMNSDYIDYQELVPVDIFFNREDIVTHWMRIKKPEIESDK